MSIVFDDEKPKIVFDDDHEDITVEVPSTYAGRDYPASGGKLLPTFARHREPTLTGDSITIGDHTYPKATGMLPTASEIPRNVLDALGDVLNIPTRWGGQARGYEMSNPESALWRPEIQGVKSAIEESKLPAKGALKFGTEVIGTTLSDPIALATLAARAVKPASKAAYKGVKKLSSELSGVPEDVLQKASTRAGRKQIAGQFGREGAIADELLAKLRKFDDYLPEKQIIDNALDNMPHVSKAKVMGVLESSKVPANVAITPEAIRANELISGIQKRFMDVGPLSATDYRKMRITLDDAIGNSWGKESGYYIDALKRARHQMAQDLIETAQLTGRPEYVDAMSTLASKLHKRDELLGWIGKTPEVQDRRTMGFVDNLFSKNKQDAQRAMRSMDEIFFGTPEQRQQQTDALSELLQRTPEKIGKDAQHAAGKGFSVARTVGEGLDDMQNLGSQIAGRQNLQTLGDQALLAQYAQQLGPQGVPSFMPMQGTGRTMMGLYGPAIGALAGSSMGSPVGGGLAGMLGSLALSSPAVSTGITLPAVGTMARGLQHLPSGLRQLALPAAAGTSSAFQDALGRLLLEEEGVE